MLERHPFTCFEVRFQAIEQEKIPPRLADFPALHTFYEPLVRQIESSFLLLHVASDPKGYSFLSTQRSGSGRHWHDSAPQYPTRLADPGPDD